MRDFEFSGENTQRLSEPHSVVCLEGWIFASVPLWAGHRGTVPGRGLPGTSVALSAMTRISQVIAVANYGVIARIYYHYCHLAQLTT